jgi:hypothetical protein
MPIPSLALDQGTGPSFDVWLPKTNGTWDDPPSQILAAIWYPRFHVALSHQPVYQRYLGSDLRLRRTGPRDALDLRARLREKGRFE